MLKTFNKYIFLSGLVMLPVQNINIDLNLFHLKFSQASTTLFLLISLLSFIIYPIKPKIKNNQLIAIILYGFFLMLVLYGSFGAYSIERAIILFGALIFCFMFSLSVLLFLNEYEDGLASIINYIRLSGAIYSIWGVVQLFIFFTGGESSVNFNSWDVVPRVPFFSSENVHAGYAVIASLFAFYFVFSVRVNWSNFIIFVLNFSGLVATGSRGAILMFCIGCVVMSIRQYFVIKKSRLALFLAFLLFIVLIMAFWDLLFIRFEQLLSGNDGTANVRISNYREIYELFIHSPMFGVGLGGALLLSDHDVHNLFMMVLFETGIISFFVYLFIFIFSFYCAMRKYVLSPEKRSQIFCVLIVSFCVLGQAMLEPSLYFFHIYLVLGMLLSGFNGRNVTNES